MLTLKKKKKDFKQTILYLKEVEKKSKLNPSYQKERKKKRKKEKKKAYN